MILLIVKEPDVDVGINPKPEYPLTEVAFVEVQLNVIELPELIEIVFPEVKLGEDKVTVGIAVGVVTYTVVAAVASIPDIFLTVIE